MDNKPVFPELRRKSFAKVKHTLQYPDFLDVQLKSFREFVQEDTAPEDRFAAGLQGVFLEHFPIQDSRERSMLEFIHYSLDPPKHEIDECLAQGLSYAAPLKAKLRLSSKEDEDEDDIQEAVEQEVYLGNLPLMTANGTFIINGAERVIVSQLHRSPGVFFGQSQHPNGTQLFSARIIPFRGSWVEFSTDVGELLWAYIDRKKKLPVTTLLRALGYSSDEDILRLFDLADEVSAKTEKAFKTAIGRKLVSNLVVERMEEVVDEDTGEVIKEQKVREVVLPAEHIFAAEDFDLLKEVGVDKIFVEKVGTEEGEMDKSTIIKTLRKDPTHNEDTALSYIYEQLRGSDAPDQDTARGVLDRLFFSEKRYDLGVVGRYRLNSRLGIDVESDVLVLTHQDIIAIIKELIVLQNGKSMIDDIDHLGNRRVRSVGEQLSSQFSIGLARMARTIKERMNLRDADNFNPSDLVNSRTISSVINTFFGTNQLSQFMDQTNPLAELTHKRRMSTLGPGGLTRERAGFEVRDVHYTHYGRLCPIETPEGPNIGLISSLCTHATINPFGFIETPYRVVRDSVVTNEIIYLTAEEEEGKVIAQSNASFDEAGNFLTALVKARKQGDFPMVPPEELDYIDIAPNQIVSPAASLIPFLEHDDANRALMGSNMQRQGVPLLRPNSPIVGTGLEGKIARDSRNLILAEADGVVTFVDANSITVKYDETDDDQLVRFEEHVKSYRLIKFRRTNQDTIFHQRPTVNVGDRVQKDTVMADSSSTQDGELALGQNVLVAFMPWRGYNFEDAIVISEKVVSEDIYTSIHIEQFELQVRDTKRGEEELTREIPNISEEATRDLDERGIIRVGAEVNAGDIVVGKITPKGETDPTPEEKLLRAIFGDKAGDVKDASLKAKPGMSGVVIHTDLFSRRKADASTKKEEADRIAKAEAQLERDLVDLRREFGERINKLLVGKKSAMIETVLGEIIIQEDVTFSEHTFATINPLDLVKRQDFCQNDENTNELVRRLLWNYAEAVKRADGRSKSDKYRAQMGDELPAGILQLARVYVAKKRKLQVGDKMAGRHGNKGVVAKIVPQEDMPFLADGTPVDIVLNPLGVPSRMNLGQILETMLGWAGDKKGLKYATPIFDGASIEDIQVELRDAGLPEDCRVQLYDGRTGDPFHQTTTVGKVYMLKLSHLVEDKIHARSIGPYSLITQQPLGGKAQFGGQRFGEMEVWALYAYGAASVLQEMLTVKSDDVKGRSKVYEAIVKGDNLPEPNVPESFNVLIRELEGLGLEVDID